MMWHSDTGSGCTQCGTEIRAREEEVSYLPHTDLKSQTTMGFYIFSGLIVFAFQPRNQAGTSCLSSPRHSCPQEQRCSGMLRWALPPFHPTAQGLQTFQSSCKLPTGLGSSCLLSLLLPLWFGFALVIFFFLKKREMRGIFFPFVWNFCSKWHFSTIFGSLLVLGCFHLLGMPSASQVRGSWTYLAMH